MLQHATSAPAAAARAAGELNFLKACGTLLVATMHLELRLQQAATG